MGSIYVITGGTDGIGGALARAYLKRGHEVVVIGRDQAKAPEGAHFVRADLSLVGETRAAIAELRSRYPKIDALVLCARHLQSERRVTAEGFEHNFALYYLSRFLLSYELADLLHAADDPVILNVAGPGPNPERVRWDDLGLESGYDGIAAMFQGGLLNDLLGEGFALNRPSEKIRYVLVNPGTVNTSFSGSYDEGVARQIEAIRASATPVDVAIQPLMALLDAPPASPLSVFIQGTPHTPAPDPGAARRLDTLTRKLLGMPVLRGVSAMNLRELLDSPVFGVIGTVQPGGEPHQSVVWVKRDGDDVLFMIAEGSRKERNLRRDPRINVLVTPADAPHTYASIQGTATMSREGTHALREELTMKYIGTSYAEHIRRTPEADHSHATVTTVRVTPERITGRL
ncbi:TIGR03618 family F420-dependent PPOX class oxidoreductase [Allokutzneria sp. A3M-2-11 16]|uniref:TIGR03618 family F420-dependent PPOX class oxidoreductase n=1 Tax=Allokutzneria sp. A3M-2-11 16 TaxID=2962043 RepID=UPI0020B7F276|nr:TIGR03618 family F420-dependent PPOX class oxidoreductase [Allokutzneria sp. A3M-2-11 16]MCP3800964.1 TIGR03618 family F420-dependent PPOX class oxidoreductase [Allokutzneria sp. A3M-2-11 16]